MAWRIGVDSRRDVHRRLPVRRRERAARRLEGLLDPGRPVPRHRPGGGGGGGRVGAEPGEIGYFGHGTTVGTNALIQHRGVRTGLLTTDGFRDLLEIGRQKRPDLYDLQADKPETLVSRDLRIDIPERIRHDGTVETPLDEAALRRAVRDLRAAGVEAVAVSFLYGFVRSEHEETALRILAEEFPEAFACASHGVAPEFREYERVSTTVVNAYLGPVMRGYIERLGQAAGGDRGQGGAAADPVQWRRHQLRDGGAAAGPHRAVRPQHRRGRGPGDRGDRRLPGPDHLRHGRHQHRCRAAGRRPVPPGRRGGGAWLPDQGADAGHPHGRGGGRLDRLLSTAAGCSRSGRAAPGPFPGRSATATAMTSRR